MNAPTRVEAEAALAEARSARTTLAANGRWFSTYLLVFAVASVPLMLLIGLGGQRGAWTGTTLWILLCSLMSWWGARQRVVLQGNNTASFLAFGGWGVLYLAALVVGKAFDLDRPTFWVPAALLSAVPLVLVARWPNGRGGRNRPASPPRSPAP